MKFTNEWCGKSYSNWMDLDYGYMVFIIDIYLLLAAHKADFSPVLAIQPVYFMPVALRSLWECFYLVDEF